MAVESGIGRYVITLILVLCNGSAQAQTLTIEPAEPRWGETITITYDTGAENAFIRPTDEARLVVNIYVRGNVQQRVYPVLRDGALLRATVFIEEGFSFLKFHMVNLDGQDEKHTLDLVIRKPDGVPAPGAHLQSMFAAGSEGWVEQFELEIGLYPENIDAYRQKWFVGGMYLKNGSQAMIEADLEALEARAQRPEIEWLYIQVFGRMSLGDEPAARAFLLDLLERFGDHPLTQAALGDYKYQCFARGIKGEGPDSVAKAKSDCISRFPASPLARKEAMAMADDKEVPMEVIEQIASAWLADEPNNPMPYVALATAANVREDSSLRTKGIQHAWKAIDGMLAGELKFRDSSGFFNSYYLPNTYWILSSMALADGRTAEALAAAQAAVEIADEIDTRCLMLLGNIWESLHEFDRASMAYAEAHLNGEAKAELALRNLYVSRYESEVGFGDYLAGLTDEASHADERPEATSFVGTSLNGSSFDLKALRGKVVVLNFWFIGCAPCRVEMPGLNEVVAQYEDRDDIVFIAFALDDEEALKKFLGEKSFDYEIVPSANDVAKAYDVSAYPTHVIIDKKGRVLSRLTGGSEDRHENLKPFIERALNE
ncbi:MAG: TlpA disulfide reductase family protein [Planctomycetota bacterium]|nr:TlpA disulfide reductase family protein [Planctomycetota bacterium]